MRFPRSRWVFNLAVLFFLVVSAVIDPADGLADSVHTPLPGFMPTEGVTLPTWQVLPPASIHSIQDPVPRSGDQPLLVILVDFLDKPKMAVLSGTEWKSFFFGLGGFANYFEEVSYGKLRYWGDVVGANGTVNGDVSAYVRLDYLITDYANGYYGFRMGADYFPWNNGGVVLHALQKLDDAGFDFSPYADPVTRRVRNLVVVFSGQAYSDSGEAYTSLEATAYRLSEAGLLEGAFTSSEGYIFDNYTLCPEQGSGDYGQMADIGVCAHEHGHALGMFDLYDLSWRTSGTGYFDLMSYGAYGEGQGQSPFHPGAFSKTYFDWATPTTITTGTFTITLEPAEVGEHFVKLYPRGDFRNQEYFLLENRQPIGFDQGWWNAGLCSGLVIWHVDETIVQRYALSNTVNTIGISEDVPEHQGIVVVEADGGFDMINPPLNYGDCGDTWAVGRTWDNDSTPSSKLWSGGTSYISVTVLSEQNGAVTLAIRIEAPVLTERYYLPLISR